MYDRTWIVLALAAGSGVYPIRLNKPGGIHQIEALVMGLGVSGFVLADENWDAGRAAEEVAGEGNASTGTVLCAFGNNTPPFPFRIANDTEGLTIYIPAPANGQVVLRVKQG